MSNLLHLNKLIEQKHNIVSKKISITNEINQLNRDNRYTQNSYINPIKIKSICTIATQKCLNELKLLLLSLDLFEDDIIIFILCDTFVKYEISSCTYKNKIVLYNELDRYDLNRDFQQESDKKMYWIDFMLEKTTIMKYALEQTSNTLFLDSDIVLLNSLPIIPNKDYDVMLSPHYIKTDHENEFGIYNGGYIYVKNKDFPDWWKKMTYELMGKVYMEQGTLDYAYQQFIVGLFEITDNFGYWKASIEDDNNVLSRKSLLHYDDNNLKYENNILNSVHTHFFNNPKYGHEYNYVLPFNKIIINNLKHTKNDKLKNIYDFIVDEQKNTLIKYNFESIHYPQYDYSNTMIFTCDNGLTNRILAIINALYFKKITNKNILIYWDINDHCNCSYYDIFETNDMYRVINKSEFENILKYNEYNYISTKPDDETNISLKNFTKKYINENIALNDLLGMIDNKITVIYSVYYFYHILSDDDIKSLYNNIKIRYDISSIVQNIIDKYKITKYTTYGIHIRKTDMNIFFSQDVQTNIHNIIDTLINNNSYANIFISSDDNDFKILCQQKYKNKIIFVDNEINDNISNKIYRSRSFIIYGLIDFLIMLNCDIKIACGKSTYSILTHKLTSSDSYWY
jgi:hypothetical protein